MSRAPFQIATQYCRVFLKGYAYLCNAIIEEVKLIQKRKINFNGFVLLMRFSLSLPFRSLSLSLYSKFERVIERHQMIQIIVVHVNEVHMTKQPHIKSIVKTVSDSEFDTPSPCCCFCCRLFITIFVNIQNFIVVTLLRAVTVKKKIRIQNIVNRTVSTNNAEFECVLQPGQNDRA